MQPDINELQIPQPSQSGGSRHSNRATKISTIWTTLFSLPLILLSTVRAAADISIPWQLAYGDRVKIRPFYYANDDDNFDVSDLVYTQDGFDQFVGVYTDAVVRVERKESGGAKNPFNKSMAYSEIKLDDKTYSVLYTINTESTKAGIKIRKEIYDISQDLSVKLLKSEDIFAANCEFIKIWSYYSGSEGFDGFMARIYCFFNNGADVTFMDKFKDFDGKVQEKSKLQDIKCTSSNYTHKTASDHIWPLSYRPTLQSGYYYIQNCSRYAYFITQRTTPTPSQWHPPVETLLPLHPSPPSTLTFLSHHSTTPPHPSLHLLFTQSTEYTPSSSNTTLTLYAISVDGDSLEMRVLDKLDVDERKEGSKLVVYSVSSDQGLKIEDRVIFQSVQSSVDDAADDIVQPEVVNVQLYYEAIDGIFASLNTLEFNLNIKSEQEVTLEREDEQTGPDNINTSWLQLNGFLARTPIILRTSSPFIMSYIKFLESGKYQQDSALAKILSLNEEQKFRFLYPQKPSTYYLSSLKPEGMEEYLVAYVTSDGEYGFVDPSPTKNAVGIYLDRGTTNIRLPEKLSIGSFNLQSTNPESYMLKFSNPIYNKFELPSVGTTSTSDITKGVRLPFDHRGVKGPTSRFTPGPDTGLETSVADISLTQVSYFMVNSDEQLNLTPVSQLPGYPPLSNDELYIDLSNNIILHCNHYNYTLRGYSAEGGYVCIEKIKIRGEGAMGRYLSHGFNDRYLVVVSEVGDVVVVWMVDVESGVATKDRVMLERQNQPITNTSLQLTTSRGPAYFLLLSLQPSLPSVHSLYIFHSSNLSQPYPIPQSHPPPHPISIHLSSPSTLTLSILHPLNNIIEIHSVQLLDNGNIESRRDYYGSGESEDGRIEGVCALGSEEFIVVGSNSVSRVFVNRGKENKDKNGIRGVHTIYKRTNEGTTSLWCSSQGALISFLPSSPTLPSLYLYLTPFNENNPIGDDRKSLKIRSSILINNISIVAGWNNREYGYIVGKKNNGEWVVLRIDNGVKGKLIARGKEDGDSAIKSVKWSLVVQPMDKQIATAAVMLGGEVQVIKDKNPPSFTFNEAGELKLSTHYFSYSVINPSTSKPSPRQYRFHQIPSSTPTPDYPLYNTSNTTIFYTPTTGQLTLILTPTTPPQPLPLPTTPTPSSSLPPSILSLCNIDGYVSVVVGYRVGEKMYVWTASGVGDGQWRNELSMVTEYYSTLHRCFCVNDTNPTVLLFMVIPSRQNTLCMYTMPLPTKKTPSPSLTFLPSKSWPGTVAYSLTPLSLYSPVFFMAISSTQYSLLSLSLYNPLVDRNVYSRTYDATTAHVSYIKCEIKSKQSIDCIIGESVSTFTLTTFTILSSNSLPTIDYSHSPHIYYTYMNGEIMDGCVLYDGVGNVEGMVILGGGIEGGMGIGYYRGWGKGGKGYVAGGMDSRDLLKLNFSRHTTLSCQSTPSPAQSQTLPMTHTLLLSTTPSPPLVFQITDMNIPLEYISDSGMDIRVFTSTHRDVWVERDNNTGRKDRGNRDNIILILWGIGGMGIVMIAIIGITVWKRRGRDKGREDDNRSEGMSIVSGSGDGSVNIRRGEGR